MIGATIASTQRYEYLSSALEFQGLHKNVRDRIAGFLQATCWHSAKDTLNKWKTSCRWPCAEVLFVHHLFTERYVHVYKYLYTRTPFQANEDKIRKRLLLDDTSGKHKLTKGI